MGVVGASGAGKSTLVSILLRLYNSDQGFVKIDDQDLKSVTQESLRRQIGMVTQETALFNRSAMDNIMYGKPSATKEDVINAARQAEAHEFISSLKDHKDREGYDAHLGEQGVKLSGGQRQRIALARAILKDAPILVLDEPTAALDAETEHRVLGNLNEWAKGSDAQSRAIFLITHRISTIRRSDNIVYLEEGRVAENGDHEALMDIENGRYRAFVLAESEVGDKAGV